MKVILYLNNVYYHTTEALHHIPVIHWMVPSVFRSKRYPELGRFDLTDSHLIEFRHCGLGNYHCHVSVEEEERIRAVKIENVD